jgi:CubicO group peptidase (beta-lactamase class C family)
VGVEVSGTVSPGWDGVRDAFAANFDHAGEVGAAVAVYRDGRPVVDLWAGEADATEGRPWRDDTIVGIFSGTKGLTAIAANLCVERGLLDVDAPVARWWPEFAAAGKEAVPVRWLLSHQVGLPYVEGTFTLAEVFAWEPMVTALAAQAPVWEPGTQHGYHMRTYGWLVGEVIRRASGAPTPGTFFRTEIAEPLGLSTWIGLPAPEHRRCARLIPPATALGDLVAGMEIDPLAAQVFTSPSDLFRYDEMWNRADLRSAEMPSSNGISDARSMARVYAACIGEVDGRRLLGEETIRRATEVQARGPDRIIGLESSYALGFTTPPMLPPACGPRAFGHGGAGGSMAFADPDAGLAFGYVMNRMRLDLEDRRAADLAAAAYEAAAADRDRR